MTVVPIDPRPDLRDWARRYGGNPMRMSAADWLDFECATEEWFARNRMSWGSVIDYRKQKKPALVGAGRSLIW
jgi:hypothetical protein